MGLSVVAATVTVTTTVTTTATTTMAAVTTTTTSESTCQLAAKFLTAASVCYLCLLDTLTCTVAALHLGCLGQIYTSRKFFVLNDFLIA